APGLSRASPPSRGSPRRNERRGREHGPADRERYSPERCDAARRREPGEVGQIDSAAEEQRPGREQPARGGRPAMRQTRLEQRHREEREAVIELKSHGGADRFHAGGRRAAETMASVS